MAKPDLSNIDLVKRRIMSEGVMGTCMYYSSSYIRSYGHYQPPTSTADPNHAVAIVGWDDSRTNSNFPKPGAWLCKNSWGSSWGYSGYFWISYYDKWCGQHPQMGAVCFQEVERMQYDKFHHHDYHGWRDTRKDAAEAFNAFQTGSAMEMLKAVSFYTAVDNVDYTVKIYDRYEGGLLKDELASRTGRFDHLGFHTVDLASPVALDANDSFFVYVKLSAGGQAFDRTSDVPVLLGGVARDVIVTSTAKAGESFYWTGSAWKDFTSVESTGNFCMKGLTLVRPFTLIEGVGSPAIGRTITLKLTATDDAGLSYVAGSAFGTAPFPSTAGASGSPSTPCSGSRFPGRRRPSSRTTRAASVPTVAPRPPRPSPPWRRWWESTSIRPS